MIEVIGACGARKYDSGCDLRFLVATLGGQAAM
jgi:hypothetical protein